MLRRRIVVLFLLLTLVMIGGCTTASDTENGRIAYLSPDENGRIQLYATDISQSSLQQLTDVAGDVHSYAAAPDGSQLVYAVRLEDGRSELWLLDLSPRLFAASSKNVLVCENALCSSPVWAPDSRRLIYEKRERLDNGDPGLPTLWWLDVNTGETITVLDESRPPNQAAAFSPDGQWLSYASPADEGVVVYGLENGRFFHVSSQLNNPAAWNTDSNQLIVADYNTTVLHGDEGTDHQSHTHNLAQSIHLFVTDITSEERRQLTEGVQVDDGTPAWSPDGEWIAFGRRLIFTDTGRQLWLVRADGSEVHPLTDDLTLHHGVPSWGEDGRFLLFQQFDTGTPDALPSIRIINIQTKQQREIAGTGFQPGWLP